MRYSEKNQKIIFEVGDWVVHKSDSPVKAFKLDNISGEVNRSTVVNGITLQLKNCRLATQDEIDAAMVLRQTDTDNSPDMSPARRFIHKLVVLLKEGGWIE